MHSKIFVNAVIRKKVFRSILEEFYFLHMVGGLSWMKMAGSLEADQLELTTSDMYICLNVLFSMFKEHNLVPIAIF